MKKLTFLSAVLAATFSMQAQSHTIALGWNVLNNGDVEFFNAHWHGNLAAPNGSLFIDGTEYAFTGIENDVDSRTGLEGALINSSYFTWDQPTGTLAKLPTRVQNDWLTVTVSNLSAGAHVFATTNIALTQWTLDDNQSSVTVNIPPPPSQVPIPAAAALFAPALLGFLGLRRKTKNTLT